MNTQDPIISAIDPRTTGELARRTDRTSAYRSN
jgi:hypothetical protein